MLYFNAIFQRQIPQHDPYRIPTVLYFNDRFPNTMYEINAMQMGNIETSPPVGFFFENNPICAPVSNTQNVVAICARVRIDIHLNPFLATHLFAHTMPIMAAKLNAYENKISRLEGLGGRRGENEGEKHDVVSTGRSQLVRIRVRTFMVRL